MRTVNKPRRLGQGTAITNWIPVIIAVVAMVVIIAVVASRVFSGVGALGTAQASANIVPNGLQVTVTAVGGGVTVQGLVILDPNGNVLYATGATPGYKAPSTPPYTWSGLYINGASASTVSTPFSLSNGQSATLVFTGNPSNTVPNTVVIFYNNGKEVTVNVAS
ncbi:hypothetical protein [Caldivirga sp.]|jgi:hypothetical protein|uniref:hypothetical protein n=1 Tax=Caldivirga sp. TaxID=2080243 RepID=UPI003D0E9795